MANCSWFNEAGCKHPAWMVWKKTLGGGKMALLMMNNDEVAAAVSVAWTDLPDPLQCPQDGCAVRDVHARADLARAAHGFTAPLAPHDSAFIVVTSS
eukprot:296455-Prymnesium_polylepis.3